MADRLQVYRNGVPHPPMDMRRRLAIELLILVALTCIYLIFMPADRRLGVDVGFALIGMGLIGLFARQSSIAVWGPPSSPAFERIPRCIFITTVFTLPPVFFFLLYGAWDAYSIKQAFWDVFVRIFHWKFFLCLLLYLPWALLQQTLFQFYLLGRLRALLPFASPLHLAILNGILFGLVHAPHWDVVVVTGIGGAVWSYSYHRDRFVFPLAISHALLGATYFSWAHGNYLVDQLVFW